MELKKTDTSIQKAETFDFADGDGKVPAKQHRNPNGTLGGWVAEGAHVDSDVHMDPQTMVYGNAKVLGHAELRGSSRVFGHATVQDSAELYDSVSVYGNAVVKDSAKIRGNVIVCENAVVSGHAEIGKESKVYGRVLKTTREFTIINGKMAIHED